MSHTWKYSSLGFWYCQKCKSPAHGSKKPDKNVKIPDHQNAASGFQKEMTCEEIVVHDIMES